MGSEEKDYKDEFFKEPMIIDNTKNYDFVKYFKENIKDKDNEDKDIKYSYTIDDQYSKHSDNGKIIEKRIYTTLTKGENIEDVDAETVEKGILNKYREKNFNVLNDDVIKRLENKYKNNDSPSETLLYISDDFVNNYISDVGSEENNRYVMLLNKEVYDKYYNDIRRILLGDALLDNNDYDRLTYLYARSGYKTLPKNLRGDNDTSDEDKIIPIVFTDVYTEDEEGYRGIAIAVENSFELQSKYRKNKTVYAPSDQLKLNEKKSTNKSIYHITQIESDPIYKENNEMFSKNLTNGIYSTNPEDKHLIFVGNVDEKIEDIKFKTIEKEDPTLVEGKTKVQTDGKNGKKITKIIYEVDKNTGELKNPKEEIVEDVAAVDKVVLVGTKKVVPATPIEDIAKTTKKAKETIKAKVVYEADEELTFEEQVIDKAPADGEKEITTVSQSGKEDVVTEDIIKEPEDGKTRVGNKKVEVKNNEDGSTTTTTTIYDVDPDTGELVNPRSTSKTTMPATPIEDIAKTTKTTKEVIKAKVQYEADEELAFEEQVVDKAPVDGEKEITTVSQSGKEDVVTEDIIKEPEDGKTRVGNKKVEVKNNEDGSTTTTTTIYDVDPDTGELVNPRSTSTTIKKPQNELYEPEGADQTTNIGKPLKPEDFITNIKDLPEDTKFEFEEQPDFDKPGESKVKIVATYPDGTKDTVESKLTVNDVEKPSTSNKTNVTPNTIKPATTAAPTRTSVKAQTGGSVGAIGGLIAGLTAAAGSVFKRRKK